jgi:tetratricopeptide (TPR) repeat protein
MYDSWEDLANSYKKHREYDMALLIIDKAIDMNPERPQWGRVLARTLEEIGDSKGAITSLSLRIASHEDSANLSEWFLYLAEVALNHGDDEPLQEVIRLRPISWYWQKTIRLYMQRGQYTRAIKLFGHFTDSERLCRLIGELYTADNDFNGGAIFFKKVAGKWSDARWPKECLLDMYFMSGEYIKAKILERELDKTSSYRIHRETNFSSHAWKSEETAKPKTFGHRIRRFLAF